jgi:hypothetical protein
MKKEKLFAICLVMSSIGVSYADGRTYNTGNQMTITQIGVVNTAIGAQSINGESTISAGGAFVDLSGLESINMLASSIYGNVDLKDAQVSLEAPRSPESEGER